MAGFAYTALTADGQLRRGHIEADDAVAAQRQLELQQLIPTEVTAHRFDYFQYWPGCSHGNMLGQVS